MDKHLTKYLVEDEGYKTFRFIGGNYVPNSINDYSTMQEGGLDVIYIKGNKKIIYGLNEFKKPPTLISPRPKIKAVINGKEFDERSDDAMNICLKEEKPENIYDAMFDTSKILIYNK
jgi:hypothetical protein